MTAAPIDPDAFFADGDEADRLLNGARSPHGANGHFVTFADHVVDAEVRIPPHDLDAERAVLSAVLIDESAFAKIAFLRPAHFYSEAHRRVFEACVDLSAAGSPVDVVTVATWLRGHGRLAQCGGVADLTDLLNFAPAVANVLAYGETVFGKWRARQVVLVGQRITAQGLAGLEASSLIASAISDLDELRPRASVGTVFRGPELAAPLPELEYLVPEIGLVAGGGAAHLIAGYGFSSKTMAVQGLEVSLVAALPIWGSYTCRDSRRVAHIDFEQGERLTRRRYQRLALAMGADLSALGDSLLLVVMPPITLTASCKATWRELMAGRDLIVVDSLRAASAGADENDSGIRSGLDMLGALSEETKCRALVIHHARKQTADDPGGRYAIRGSSAIFDACDSAYVFSSDKGEPVRVEHVKARSHGEPVPDFALVVSDVEFDGDPRAGLRVQVHGAELVTERRAARDATARKDRSRRDAELVRTTIAAKPGLGSRELRAATGLSGDRMSAAIAYLGDALDVRDEVNGRVRMSRHFLRGIS